MLATKICKGKRITLRQIELGDCNANYVRWLNNPEVNKFLETKWCEQNLDTIKEFVISQRENSHSILFAIIDNESREHIGNIKIGPVHTHYKYAEVSYFIGATEYWGKGIATEAIKLVCEYGFSELELHRIEAGTYASAYGSQRALEKNGFQREGVLREKVICDGVYMDVYKYALLEEMHNTEI